MDSECDPEDILSSSLETLYEYQPITHSSAGSLFTFHPKHSPPTSPTPTISLITPDTDAANWKLHASSIWVSALFLADHLAELHLGDGLELNVLELGAGAGLPGILIAKLYHNVRVTLSDYPDQKLMRTLSDNVKRNDVVNRCRVVPYDWGSDPSPLLPPYPLKSTPGFDVILAADTLWNPELHSRFIDTLRLTLKRTTSARAHLIAGLHTGRYTIQAFLREMGETKLFVESVVEREVSGEGRREWCVERAESEDERERRRWVVWMTIKWKSV
ncbi:hypothetical protein JAAARDRAFT_171788 [Jaapia argillacea MUCL 33604]|uniref:Elongation factor methyltransferase 7 n=1 Tax=Jaapia argillacea MUCL 33604 TaxID=933084 RepID=A0A067Q393_9AGAM|nr:hypothetical protein JAAARDRAFT_171788 [Jaapia argillacea MUCL 33604]